MIKSFIDTELEDVVIGSVLCDYNCIDFVLTNLKTEDFFNTKNQILFNSFLRLYSDAKKIDLVSLHSDLKNNGESEQVDMSYILNLSNKIASIANIETHIELLKNESVKKHLLIFGQKILQGSINETISAKSILTDFINQAQDLQNRTSIQKVTTFKDSFNDTVKECLDGSGKSILGVTSGFNVLDSKTSGFSAPDLTIIAAGPGEGKSTFALNIAKHVSLTHGDVLYFSYEMKEKQLIYKLISDDLNISVLDVRLGCFEKNYLATNKTHLAKLHIYDKGSLTIDDLISITKIQAKKLDLKLVIIDYLQLIKLGAYIRKLSNRNDEVTVISNKLKAMAMDLNLPVIALSQLNRDKTRKRYSKADLRDSGAIEQDADNIIFIFRPCEHDGTYEIDFKPLDNIDEKTAIINVDKWRLGRTGEFVMNFNGEHSRFEDIDRREYNYNPYEMRVIKNDVLPF